MTVVFALAVCGCGGAFTMEELTSKSLDAAGSDSGSGGADTDSSRGGAVSDSGSGDAVGDVGLEAGGDASEGGSGDIPCGRADAQPACAILFGGLSDDGGLLQDTWQWRDGGWKQLQVSGPSARDAPGLAPLGSELVLFGGNDGTEKLQDTWTWDSSDWRAQVSGPPPRYQAALAPFGGALVLFGGYGGATGYSYLADTWTWDATKWTLLTPSGTPPSPRVAAVMAPLGGKLLLFGGVYRDSNNNATVLGDTWLWTGTAWQEKQVSPSPSARYGAVMAPLGNTLVLFGGVAGCLNDSSCSYLSDTWMWDGIAWTQLALGVAPSARDYAVMAPVGGKLLLFGGNGQSGVLDDTWLWDGAAWQEEQVSGPPPRHASAMASF
jgi:hypothetical protein